MRFLVPFAALLATAMFAGCQSCTTPNVPIVGDSMSQFASPEMGCSSPVPMMTTATMGAACGDCGTPGCGGQCLARMRAMMAARRCTTDYSDFGTDDCLSCGCAGGMDNCGPGHGGMGNGRVSNCGLGGGCGAGGGSGLGGRVRGAMRGCGGNVCNGSCGGRCGMALAMRNGASAVSAAARARAMQNPHVAKLVSHTQRQCAYGRCGGALGPQQGQVTFPYYTIRGPRDFLNPNPPSIGP